VIVLADKNNNTNILYWLSTKYKRVTRSILASELYAISHGFDILVSLKSIIKNFLGLYLTLVFYRLLSTPTPNQSTTALSN
jgi:hypothetical protein